MEGLQQCHPSARGTFSDPSSWDILGTQLQHSLSLASRTLLLIQISDAGIGRADPAAWSCDAWAGCGDQQTSLASDA